MLKSVVAVVMGSISDWGVMKYACKTLEKLDIIYEKKVVSAHRTPDLMFAFAENARERNFKAIIAGAGGAAHLPGMLAAKTTLPVIGVPVQSKALNGLDSLLSIVQMPGGIPVATVAIGKAGAINAGLLAAQMLAAFDEKLAQKLEDYRLKIKQMAIESSEKLV
ncbi:MAG: 5-(carboxyamino)imidazole ribonucleotide mutase [Streptococcaceae bacterium]|jgi:5-(carboxyamino)imidazole ribonucleotide mutase|nr:5-(carboxyamino)imidazole ribonucleotide mutase [Streptococcaceae bacterium]